MAKAKKSRKNSRPDRLLNPKKKVRSERGVSETKYGEVKKNSSFSITPTSLILLKDLSREIGISTSELLERLARIGADLKDILR